MKKSRIKKINMLLRLYVVFGLIIVVVGILAMQTKLSVLNQEYVNNQKVLDDLKRDNSYKEMQMNENLTRDKIVAFADQNGLKRTLPIVVDIDDESESE